MCSGIKTAVRMGIWRSFTTRAFESFLKKCARRAPSRSMESGFQGTVPELCWVNSLTHCKRHPPGPAGSQRFPAAAPLVEGAPCRPAAPGALSPGETSQGDGRNGACIQPLQQIRSSRAQEPSQRPCSAGVNFSVQKHLHTRCDFKRFL